MLGLKLGIEPTCEIAQGFGDARFGIGCQGLARRAVAVRRDIHAAFVVVPSTMGHVGSDLEEVPALQILQGRSDAMKLGVHWGMRFDFRDGAFGIPDAGLEASVMRCTA